MLTQIHCDYWWQINGHEVIKASLGDHPASGLGIYLYIIRIEYSKKSEANYWGNNRTLPPEKTVVQLGSCIGSHLPRLLRGF